MTLFDDQNTMIQTAQIFQMLNMQVPVQTMSSGKLLCVSVFSVNVVVECVDFVVSCGGVSSMQRSQSGIDCRRVEKASSQIFCFTISATTAESGNLMTVLCNCSQSLLLYWKLVDLRQRFSKSMYSVGSVSGSVDCQSREKTISYKSRRVFARETLRKSRGVMDFQWSFSGINHCTAQFDQLQLKQIIKLVKVYSQQAL